MSFWGELKRRNIYKVGVAYAIVAWLLIQAAAIIFPHLNLPSWAVTLLIVFLIACFPIALLLAWAYEVTPDGIKRTKEVPLAESITQLTGKKLNYILAGLLVIAIAYIVIDKVFLGRRTIYTEVVSMESEQTPNPADVEEAPKIIAVLPFADLSPEKDQEYFVDGLSEEILNSLCQIPDLNVIGRTSSFSFKGSNKTVQEIASLLGADNILEGSVRKAGNALRITAQLLRATDGVHLWSKTYDRELTDIFAVQEDIATTVADELKVTLEIGKFFKQLGGTDNVEAYELYLVALGQMTNNKKEHALESLNAVIALDPEFSLAWALKANIHASNSMVIPYGLVAAELDAGLRAAQRAIEIEPNSAEATIALGHTKSVRHDWIQAELAYREAIKLQVKQMSGNFNTYTKAALYMHYMAVANFKKAYTILEELRRSDPLNAETHMDYIFTSGILGDMEEAKSDDERCRSLFGDRWDSYTWVIISLRMGVDDSLSRDEIPSYNPLWSAAKAHFDSPKEGLAELRRFYNEDVDLSTANLIEISLMAAYFGDPKLALDAANKAAGFQAVSIYCFWLPVMHEVRKLPWFKEFVREVGLVDYWNKFGWPDICRQLDNGDFECQ